MKIRQAALHTLASSLTLSLALPASAQQNSGDESGMMMEEIIVTTRKRSESLLDIPITVSAFSAEDIQNAGYASVQDLVEAVPGVTYGSYQAEGQGDSPSFRGVAGNTGDPTLQNSSKFIDGVYVSGSLYSVLFTDIERVEVIKGPQSALFGRATFSGAINYITKRPTEELSGSVDATIAEYGETRLNGTVSGFLIEDTLGVRVSAGMLSEGSPYDNVTTGREMGDNDLFTGSMSVLFTPTESLTTNLYVNYSEAEFGEAIRATTPLNEGELEFPVAAKIGSNLDQLPSPGIDSETLRANFTIDWDLGEYTLSSVSGYGNEDSVNQADGDYQPEKTLGFLSFLCNAGPFVGPDCDIFQTEIETELETVFQELRIASAEDQALRWLAGVSYFEEEYFRNRTRNFSQAEELKTSENISIFGSVAYDFSEKVTATFDARYQEETVEFEQGGVLTNEGDFDNFLPRAIVEYTPSESSMWYLSASKGNKPGTFNGTGPEEFRVVDEEELWSYELGTKFSTADNRVTVEAALYYMDWENQVFRFTDPEPTVGSYLVNSGETEIWGIDFSTMVRITENLTGSLAYSYVDAEYKVFESTTAAAATGNADVSGNATPRTPENSAYASLRYDAPVNLFGDGNNLFARADVSYRDEQYIDEINLEYLEPQTLVNLRVGVDTGAARITLFVDNAFDNDAPTTGFRFGQVALVGLPIGRQVGITAAYNF